MGTLLFSHICNGIISISSIFKPEDTHKKTNNKCLLLLLNKPAIVQSMGLTYWLKNMSRF